MKTNTEDSWVLTAPTNAFTLLVTQQTGYLSFWLAAYRGIAPISDTTSGTASEARSSVEKREVVRVLPGTVSERQKSADGACAINRAQPPSLSARSQSHFPFRKCLVYSVFNGMA